MICDIAAVLAREIFQQLIRRLTNFSSPLRRNDLFYGCQNGRGAARCAVYQPICTPAAGVLLMNFEIADDLLLLAVMDIENLPDTGPPAWSAHRMASMPVIKGPAPRGGMAELGKKDRVGVNGSSAADNCSIQRVWVRRATEWGDLRRRRCQQPLGGGDQLVQLHGLGEILVDALALGIHLVAAPVCR